MTSAGEMVTGEAAYYARYETWGSAQGLLGKGGCLCGWVGELPASDGRFRLPMAVAIMGVLVASFAGTTLDTACRLQRYVIQELAATFVNSGHTPSRRQSRPTR